MRFELTFDDRRLGIRNIARRSMRVWVQYVDPRDFAAAGGHYLGNQELLERAIVFGQRWADRRSHRMADPSWTAVRRHPWGGSAPLGTPQVRGRSFSASIFPCRHCPRSRRPRRWRGFASWGLSLDLMTGKACALCGLLLRVRIQIRPPDSADRLPEHSGFSQAIDFAFGAVPSLGQRLARPAQTVVGRRQRITTPAALQLHKCDDCRVGEIGG
jgi:hypothetical protein